MTTKFLAVALAAFALTACANDPSSYVPLQTSIGDPEHDAINAAADVCRGPSDLVYPRQVVRKPDGSYWANDYFRCTTRSHRGQVAGPYSYRIDAQ